MKVRVVNKKREEYKGGKGTRSKKRDEKRKLEKRTNKEKKKRDRRRSKKERKKGIRERGRENSTCRERVGTTRYHRNGQDSGVER